MKEIIKKKTMETALKAMNQARVSDGAAKTLQKHMNEYLLVKSAMIVKEAQYNGRKTVLVEDVEAVLNRKNDNDTSNWET